MTAQDWERQRNALNHDWLKNEFVRHLLAFISRLLETAPELSRLAEFVDEDWSKWKSNSKQVAALLDSAEFTLSPSRLLEAHPLNQCHDAVKPWLSEVVHALWLRRTSIRRYVENGRAALTDADRTYDRHTQLVFSTVSPDAVQARRELESFKGFCEAVENLGNCVSDLPHGIEVV